MSDKKLIVEIYSKKAIMERIIKDSLSDCAVISFYSPQTKNGRINYEGLCKDVFYVMIPDIDIELLSQYGYTYDTYLGQADGLAAFIYRAKAQGKSILCQCDYGQSRSAACAAAILQHFEGRGIDIFADYRYYPNQLVYHRVLDALEAQKSLAKTNRV